MNSIRALIIMEHEAKKHGTHHILLLCNVGSYATWYIVYPRAYKTYSDCCVTTGLVSVFSYCCKEHNDVEMCKANGKPEKTNKILI